MKWPWQKKDETAPEPERQYRAEPGGDDMCGHWAAMEEYNKAHPFPQEKWPEFQEEHITPAQQEQINKARDRVERARVRTSDTDDQAAG